MKYLIYRIRCFIYGHKYTCCSDIKQDCNKCGYRDLNLLSKIFDMKRQEIIDDLMQRIEDKQNEKEKG